MLSCLHFFDENSKIPIEKGIQNFEKTFLNFLKFEKIENIKFVLSISKI